MYELNDTMYRSKSTNKEIPISHMDFQHAMRTLRKFCEEEEKVTIGANDIVLTKDEVIKAKDSIINGLRSQVETYQEKLEAKPKDYTLEELRKEKDEALDEGVSLSNQLEGLKEQLEEKDKEQGDKIKINPYDNIPIHRRLIDKKNAKVGIFDLGNHILIVGFILIVIFISLNVT